MHPIGEVVRAAVVMFPTLLVDYDTFLEARGTAPTTRKSYRYELTRYWCDWCALRGIEIAHATEAEVLAYWRSLPAHGSKRGDAGRALKSFYGWLDGRVRDDDPSRELKVPRPRPGDTPMLGADAERRLLRAAFTHEPRRGWAILLALSTGARIG
jgi:site-specific recombinase XerD